jgi:hypothetical protein
MATTGEPSWPATGAYTVVPALSGRVRHHRVRRTIGYLLGVVLVVTAYVALLPVMTIAAAFVVLSVSEGQASPPAFEPSTALFIAGSIVAAVLLWKLGVVLIRGKRHLALFLRKFGFTQATETLSLAIGSGLGRRWRLVTLDDHDVAPMGVSGQSRWTVRLVRLVLVALAVAATVGGIRAVAGSATDEAANEAYDQAYADAIASGDSELEAAFSAGFSKAVTAVLMAVLVVVLWSVLISLLATGSLLFTVIGRSARRAERAKAVVVVRDAQVSAAAHRLRRASRRVLAPRVTVARVADRLWQLLVRALASTCDVVLVDVSYPTKNLLWEIQSLEELRARWLPIGQSDRLGALVRDPSPEAAELRQLLAGREVIGYRIDAIDAFSDGLRRSLDLVAARRRHPR